MSNQIAIRCIADNLRGYGHFSRCLAIANYFSQKNFSVIFLINNNSRLKIELNKLNIKYSIIPNFKTKNQEGIYLTKYVEKNLISYLILDMREFSESISKTINTFNCMTILIDDSTVKNVHSDVLLNGTSITKYQKYKKSNRNANLLLGLKYFIINSQFLKYKKKLSDIKSKNKYKITISCGGSDVNNLTLKILNQIISLKNIQIKVIVGPLMKSKFKTSNFPKYVKFIHSPNNIWKIFHQSDLVICTSGSTLFELAAQGIPCINIAAVTHQIPYGVDFSKKGFGIFMGFWKKVDFLKLSEIAQILLSDVSKRKKMSSNGKRLIDGKGLQRLEKILLTK